jgi:hypothetical protein
VLKTIALIFELFPSPHEPDIFLFKFRVVMLLRFYLVVTLLNQFISEVVEFV